MMIAVYSEIDKFDQDLKDKRIEFKPDAPKLKVYESVKGFLGKAKEQDVGEFQYYLGNAVANYKTTVNPVMKWQYAQECLRYIKIAYQYNMLITDLDKSRVALEEENKVLRKAKDNLEGKIKELEAKIKDQRELLELRGIHEVNTAGKEDEDDEPQ
jgi:hypothetical protein